MAKKILQKQIIQTDIWENTIESTKELIGLIDKLENELKRTSKTSKEIVKVTQKPTFEGLKETTQEVDKLNDAFEAKIKLDKERAKLEKELVKLQKKVKDELEKLNETVNENASAYDKLNKETKKAEKIAKDLATQYGKTDKRTLDAVKSFKKLEKELIKVNKVTKDTVEQTSKRVQLEEKLKNLTSEEAKELSELSVKIQEQNKANKELARVKLGLIDTYSKESKRLIILRKQYKNVVLEQGKSSKAAKELRKEVIKLDKQLKEVDESAGQFQRSVGNYPDTLGEAAGAILGIASAAGVASGALSAAQNGLAATEEGGGAMAELGAQISGVWDVVSNTVAGAVLDLKDFTVAAGENYASGKGLVDSFSEAADGQGRLASSNKNLIAQTELQIALKTSLARKERAYAKQLRETKESIEELNGAIDIQQAIAGDSTRSFNELARAVRKAQELQIERGNKNVELARKEFDLAQQRVFISEQLVGEGNASIALYDQETEAIIALQAAQNDLAKEVIEGEIELRQIRQDRLERDLDILLDGYDNQKTINERIIANDKETIKTRQDLLDETIQKGNKSFAGQVEILQRLTKNKVDYNELLSIDATELNKRIRSLGASEIIEGRILEVIRDRKTELNDLTEAQQDLNDATNENLDLNADINAQYDKLLGNIKDIDARRLENEKESLKRRINELEDGSNAELRLIQEYNEILLAQQEEYEQKESERLEKNAQNKAEAQKKLREEEIAEDKKFQEYLDAQEEKKRQKEIENREKTLAVLEALNNKYFNDKKAQIDAEIEAAENREQTLQELANNGNRDAAESLAANQKQQAEANKKKDDLLKKEKAFETALAIIQSYNAALDEGDSNSQALAKAITSVTVLTSIAESLPSFYDGTEDTGKVSNPLDSKGGRLSVLHDNERVVDKKNNDKMGGVSNEKAANIVKAYNENLLTDVTSINTPHLSLEKTRFDTNEQVLNKFDILEKSIVSAIENKETYLGSDVDTFKQILTQYYKKSGTKTVVKSKVNIF